MDAKLKKRVGLQEKLQSLLCNTNERSMTTRVVNLSKRILSPAEISLLSKGIGFNHTDATPTNILAGLESVLLASALPEDRRADIRSCAFGILRKRRHQQTLPMEEEKGLRSLRSDDTIVVVSADKGGATVITDKTDYVNKANQAFNDREAYTPIAEDPTKKQAASLKKKVNELTRKKLINPADSKFLTPNDTRIAHAYGLPKVHKIERVLKSFIHGHKLNECRGDGLPQVTADTFETVYEYNSTVIKLIAHTGSKTSPELIEAWASDETSAVRRVELAPACRALRDNLHTYVTDS
nr:unnamed protein product [Spirometra erinaceieuropaei]